MSSAGKSFITLRSRSIWNHWNFDLLDEDTKIIGRIDLPMWSQAKNARLTRQAPKDAIAAELNIRGKTSRIRFEYLSRGWSNEIRWTLESDDAQTLICLDQMRPGKKQFASPHFLLKQPFVAELLAVSGRWGNIRMDLKMPDGIPIPCISTPSLFNIRRELQVENETLTEAGKAFIGFVALSFYLGS